MAHFRGTVDGKGQTQANRLGTKKTGIETNVASWSGGVTTRMWHDESTGLDMFEVEQVPHHGQGVRRVLMRGVVGGSVEVFHNACVVYRFAAD